MKHGKGFMKRTGRVLSLLILTIGLFGCGNSEEETGAAPEVKTEQIPVEEKQSSALDVFGEEEISEQRDGKNDGEETPESGAAADCLSASEGLGNEGPGDGADQETKETASEEEHGKVPPAEVKDRPQGWSLALASEDWGLSFGESGAAPTGNASSQDLAWYDAYYVGDGSEKVIYLTFDCGYENGNTEPILDALKKHNAPGTFFVVGHFLETAPEMIKRMVEEGHAVGNHTYHHPDMSAISDLESFQKEVDGVASLFYEITGTELSPFYRPPQGKCNVKNLEMAQELGYYTIFWSLAHVDWITDNQPSHEEALDKLTKRIHPGAVVLLHNTSQTNGEILDELLTKWEEMGYSFRPLGELVG